MPNDRQWSTTKDYCILPKWHLHGSIAWLHNVRHTWASSLRTCRRQIPRSIGSKHLHWCCIWTAVALQRFAALLPPTASQIDFDFSEWQVSRVILLNLHGNEIKCSASLCRLNLCFYWARAVFYPFYVFMTWLRGAESSDNKQKHILIGIWRHFDTIYFFGEHCKRRNEETKKHKICALFTSSVRMALAVVPTSLSLAPCAVFTLYWHILCCTFVELLLAGPLSEARQIK